MTEITDNVTQSVIFFNLLPGCRDEFLETFQRLGVLQISSYQAGYRGGQLHIAVGDPDVALVTAQWDSPAAYAGWLENPRREEIGAHLRPFCVEEPRGCVFDVVQDVPPLTPGSGA